jgi:8-oxo-dGTP pyrophosphatase MutT (NUDIX family)
MPEAGILDDAFLDDRTRLRASDAVAALLILENGDYLLQERDAIPGIWFPGHWGLFGGSIEPGESLIEALVRELAEELDLPPSSSVESFTSFEYDLSAMGQGKVFRHYFVRAVSEAERAVLTLHEGMQMRGFSSREIFSGLKVTPYDAFVLWLHASQERLRWSPA